MNCKTKIGETFEMSAIETENILKFKAGYSTKKISQFIKKTSYKDLLTYIRIFCHEVGDYMETLYHLHRSKKGSIFVKTLFSTTAAMVATGVIIWKPGFMHQSMKTPAPVPSIPGIRRGLDFWGF